MCDDHNKDIDTNEKIKKLVIKRDTKNEVG